MPIAYRVTVSWSEEEASFIGVRGTPMIGTYKSEVFMGDMVRLGQSLRRKNFFGLSNGYYEHATDQVRVDTTVVDGSRRKSVAVYGNAAPQDLWEIQAIIEGIASRGNWHKVSDSTIYPALPSPTQAQDSRPALRGSVSEQVSKTHTNK